MNRGQTHIAEQAQEITQRGLEVVLYFGEHKFAVKKAQHVPEQGVVKCTTVHELPLLVDVGALLALTVIQGG